MASPKKGATRKRRERKNIEKGAAHIRSSFNNTMVTITDTNGNELEMPSAFDEFSEKANRDYSDATETARANAEALEKAMKESGFVEYYEEWWHYEDTVDYPPEQDLFSRI